MRVICYLYLIFFMNYLLVSCKNIPYDIKIDKKFNITQQNEDNVSKSNFSNILERNNKSNNLNQQNKEELGTDNELTNIHHKTSDQELIKRNTRITGIIDQKKLDTEEKTQLKCDLKRLDNDEKEKLIHVRSNLDQDEEEELRFKQRILDREDRKYNKNLNANATEQSIFKEEKLEQNYESKLENEVETKLKLDNDQQRVKDQNKAEIYANEQLKLNNQERKRQLKNDRNKLGDPQKVNSKLDQETYKCKQITNEVDGKVNTFSKNEEKNIVEEKRQSGYNQKSLESPQKDQEPKINHGQIQDEGKLPLKLDNTKLVEEGLSQAKAELKLNNTILDQIERPQFINNRAKLVVRRQEQLKSDDNNVQCAQKCDHKNDDNKKIICALKKLKEEKQSKKDADSECDEECNNTTSDDEDKNGQTTDDSNEYDDTETSETCSCSSCSNKFYLENEMKKILENDKKQQERSNDLNTALEKETNLEQTTKK